ncbi:MAG TPA: hypothetical protein VJZ00_24625, partial [Thermoanaerobaculia bacterium]|nr:hypothetical protein [Thermoanaerobaculia bacterium]
SVVAFVAWVSGMTSAAELPRVVLAFGQLLNVLVFFAVYCAAAALFRSRRVALLAATIATLVSLFPAYYVSWGRYTQLCGLLLLPPLARAFWRLGRHPRWREAVEVTVLAAGLVLIHMRVAIVFGVLAAMLFALFAMQRRWRGMAWCAAAGAASLVIASPWLVQLVRTPQVRAILAPAANDRAQWETSNAAPDDLLWAPHNALLYSLSTAGLLGLTPVRFPGSTRAIAIAWWVLLVILLQHKAKRRSVRRYDGWRLAIIAAWVVILALLINLDRIGMPRLRALPNSAAIIMLFLPISLATAHLARWVLDEVMVEVTRKRVVMTALTIVVAIVGAFAMLHIVNPVTVLATAADRDALEWIHANTPRDARFAVGVQPWIGGSYIGNDGGYWIPIVAERASLLPPGLYPWVMPQPRVKAITRELTSWYDAQQSGDPAILTRLQNEGVTHVYFGARNETPLRAVMAAVPGWTRVYARKGAEVWSVTARRRAAR